MSQSTTTKTRAPPFAERSTARAGVGQEMKQSEIVRTEGEEGQPFDGLLCHRYSPEGEEVNPLSWDDADSGAPTIERVDWTCDRRSALMAGPMVGLMIGVMNPLGWAFTVPLIPDPSVRWLVPSPAREAPGWAFVGWLMQRTGSIRRHLEEHPGALR